MSIKALYDAIKSNDKDLKSINTIDVNRKDPNGYTLIHFATMSNDVEFVKELMKRGTIYNSKTNDGKTPKEMASDIQLKNLFNTIRMFFKAIKKGNFDKISEFIAEERSLVNVKEEGGGNALHWAANNGRRDIAKLLLDNSADIFQVTEKGNTALHIAISAEKSEIVHFLLNYFHDDVSLLEFVNIQTFYTKSSCLHIAAENGDFDTVKLLLQHGAIYNIENNVGATPFDVTKNKHIKDFLKLINDLFVLAVNGDDKLFLELHKLKHTAFEAVIKTQDVNKNTIETLADKHEKDFVSKLEVLVKSHQKNFIKIDGWRYEELSDLKYFANIHVRFSDTYIPMLTSYSSPTESDINSNPWKTLKEGSYFLGNAYRLVQIYKEIRPGSIEDESIKIINDSLNKFQFHPSHISGGYTEEAYGGQVECFVSKAQGNELYYKLLHGKNRKDVRNFIDIVSDHINTPVQNFLAFLEEKLHLFPSYQLLKAIENINMFKVEECLRNEADVNFENCRPLLYAVKNGSLNILKILIRNGAEIQHVFDQGNSILHVAVSSISRNNVANEVIDLGVIKYLLRCGAVYNHKNKRDKTPLDESSLPLVRSFLSNVVSCFQIAENDDPKLFTLLRSMGNDDFAAMTGCRNANGQTLLQVAVNSGRKFESKLWEVIKNAERINSEYSPEDMFESKLKKIKQLAENQVRFSEIYLLILRKFSEPGDSEINQCPWKTLMEGSYYLSNAYKLVHEYKESFTSFPEDKNIEIIREILERFQFDPKHITTVNEDIHGEPFVSNAIGTEYYYRLLHSEQKSDVRQFIELAEQFIDRPAKEFLNSSCMVLYQNQACIIL